MENGKYKTPPIVLNDRENSILRQLKEKCIHDNVNILVAYFQHLAKKNIKDFNNPTEKDKIIAAYSYIAVDQVVAFKHGDSIDCEKQTEMLKEIGEQYIEFLKDTHFVEED